MFEKQASFLGKWGWNIIRASFFWLCGNLVYIFLILNGFVSENVNEIGTLVITGIILIPFILAPGTVAAFSCVRVFDHELKNVSWKLYKTAYKQSFKIAMFHGLSYIALLFILYSAYWYYGAFFNLGQWVPLFTSYLLTVLFLFILAYTSDREESFLNYWKLGSLLLINHPMFTLFMGTEIFFVLYFCQYLGALLFFVAPGAILLIVHYFYTESVKAEVKKMNG